MQGFSLVVQEREYSRVRGFHLVSAYFWDILCGWLELIKLSFAPRPAWLRAQHTADELSLPRNLNGVHWDGDEGEDDDDDGDDDDDDGDDDDDDDDDND